MIFRRPAESIQRRYDAGKKLRVGVPRAAQGQWAAAPHRPHPLKTIAAVNQGRIKKLMPEKYRRMRMSPFAFFRGAAALMASDLSTLPSSGVTVQICGDAHVHNLGAYAAPDGRLVFDINDFDETTPGPWEWDLKRLATSLVLAGEQCGQAEWRCEDAVRAMVASYRQHMREFALMPFATLARHLITRRREAGMLDTVFQAAQRITPARNLKRLTVNTQGRFRFRDQKPILEHVPPGTAASVVHALKDYVLTLNASRRRTFERYRPADVAFKLVGTGSVGTRDYVVLLFGNDANDPLFIQVKQELPSCCAAYLPASRRRRRPPGPPRLRGAADDANRVGSVSRLHAVWRARLPGPSARRSQGGTRADGAGRRRAPRLRQAVRRSARQRPCPDDRRRNAGGLCRRFRETRRRDRGLRRRLRDADETGFPAVRHRTSRAPALVDFRQERLQVRPHEIRNRPSAGLVRMRAIALHQGVVGQDLHQEGRHQRDAVPRGEGVVGAMKGD